MITFMAWLPLLLLSLPGATSLAQSVKQSFLRDIEVDVRLLIALPLLIAAELVVNSRIPPVVNAFLSRRIVVEQDLRRFRAPLLPTPCLVKKAPYRLFEKFIDAPVMAGGELLLHPLSQVRR